MWEKSCVGTPQAGLEKKGLEETVQSLVGNSQRKRKQGKEVKATYPKERGRVIQKSTELKGSKCGSD